MDAIQNGHVSKGAFHRPWSELRVADFPFCVVPLVEPFRLPSPHRIGKANGQRGAITDLTESNVRVELGRDENFGGEKLVWYVRHTHLCIFYMYGGPSGVLHTRFHIFRGGCMSCARRCSEGKKPLIIHRVQPRGVHALQHQRLYGTYAAI